MAEYTPLKDVDLDDFNRVMDINTTGQLRVCQAVSRQMATQEPCSITTRHGTRSLGRGNIVNVASGFAYGVVPGRIAYITSKHALLGITKAAGTFYPFVSTARPLDTLRPVASAGLASSILMTAATEFLC
jgi:NAD(P)-dependent dehydrogenase (short-subunit alcohol dehydrogenase family)